MIEDYQVLVLEQLFQPLAKNIGYARAYDFNQKFNVGVSTDKYDLRLYDIQTFTEITVGLNLTAAKDSYVKGQFSGSTGFFEVCSIQRIKFNAL